MEDKQLATKPILNQSERFASMVYREYGGNVGHVDLSDSQKQLIQGYFIGIDRALKLAEEARQRKKKNQDPTPVTWENVNLTDLAIDVYHNARMGLDMQMDNHLFAIPYKNNKTGKYDITLMQGYNGKKYIAEKYAVDTPTNVTVELVYEKDTFVAIKKSKDHPFDTYTFDINEPFNRGKVMGGFGYIEFANPVKNKLITMTVAQIEKRKPSYASPEFWGGKKPKWEDGKVVGEDIVEGWYDEMCLKTLIREVYSSRHIPRDPAKIDENFRFLKRRDAEYIAALENAEESDYSSAITIDITPPDQQNSALPPYDSETGEITPAQNAAPAGAQADNGTNQMGMRF